MKRRIFKSRCRRFAFKVNSFIIPQGLWFIGVKRGWKIATWCSVPFSPLHSLQQGWNVATFLFAWKLLTNCGGWSTSDGYKLVNTGNSDKFRVMNDSKQESKLWTRDNSKILTCRLLYEVHKPYFHLLLSSNYDEFDFGKRHINLLIIHCRKYTSKNFVILITLYETYTSLKLYQFLRGVSAWYLTLRWA